jgi:hypothetical protein
MENNVEGKHSGNIPVPEHYGTQSSVVFCAVLRHSFRNNIISELEAICENLPTFPDSSA